MSSLFDLICGDPSISLRNLPHETNEPSADKRNLLISKLSAEESADRLLISKFQPSIAPVLTGLHLLISKFAAPDLLMSKRLCSNWPITQEILTISQRYNLLISKLSAKFPVINLLISKCAPDVDPTHLLISKFHCLRCNHVWIPRSNNVRLCPSCKSRFFQNPRNSS